MDQQSPHTIRAALQYLWALPNTLVGLFFVPVALLTGGRMQIVEGVLEVHGEVIAAILTHAVPLPGGAAAITFGHVVLGRDPASLAASRTHERVHVRQCELWGPAFIPAYLITALWGWITGEGAYEGNYFERQAISRSEADSFCESAGGRWRRSPWP